MNNEIGFKERLQELKMELLCTTNQEMAYRLGITPSLYSMLERGKRQPSRKFLLKLEEITGKGEEYWLYGIENTKEYITNREAWKSTNRMLDMLYKHALIEPDYLIRQDIVNLILESINIDLKYKSEKDNL